MGTLTGAMMNYNREAYNSTKAVALANDKMEEMRNLDYQSLTSLGSGYDPPDSIFTRAWTVTTNTPDTDMTTITVTVSWTWKGTTKNTSFSSIVGR